MRDEDRAAAAKCDYILQTALDAFNKAGVPMHVAIDRLATYAAYASVVYAGKAHTVEQFKAIATTVEAGVFDGIAGKPVGRG